MRDVLLTGFEPFGGEDVNPSWEAVRVARDRDPDVTAVLLPVDFVDAGALLAETVERIRPRIVVAVGQAGGRAAVTVERVAINVDDARIPDRAGRLPIDEAIVPDGPAAYFSTLPIKACVTALAARGIPAAVSQTAGTYVCNHVFYRLMHTLATLDGPGPAARAGFVHVPYTPDQVPRGDHPSMALELMVDALRTIVRTTADTAVDLRVTGGTTH